MKKLIIKDKIYGQFKISEPVLIDLLNSKAMDRLKGVSQKGAWDLHQNCKSSFSRYEHSLGVMLLLKKFNAPLEEQIAGLLHDISHTAFSHVADFVFNSNYLKHDYQDNKMTKAFEIQGINKILKKHSFNPSYILDKDNFPLLENDLPNLCADRIDYTLREFPLEKISKISPKKIIDNLVVFKKQFVFTEKIWAKRFASIYLKLNIKTWCNPMQSSLYKILADTIKIALQKNIITTKNLFSTDDELIKRLKNSKDKKILGNLKILKKLKVKLVSKNQADFFTRSKPRVVDPYFLKNKKLVRLTDLDKTYKKQTDKWLKQAKKGFYIKIIGN